MKSYTHIYLSRFVIEFSTPVLISSGDTNFFSDTSFVTDANGLPTIPGTSIAGVLRSKILEEYGEVTAGYIFGKSDKKGDIQINEGSKLSISFGCIHNRNNSVVEGLLDISSIYNDSVLNLAYHGVLRDHVKITKKGVASSHGKFDEVLVSSGNRFTFEMFLSGTDKDINSWNQLKSILLSDSMRIGGRTRRGIGEFQVIEFRERCFNMQDNNDLSDYLKYPPRLSVTWNGGSVVTSNSITETYISTDNLSFILSLKPEGFWMVGGGSGNEFADMTPIQESKVVWNSNHIANVKQCVYLVPASSIKGAISHRTSFYYNGILKQFADKGYDQDTNEGIRQLFGFVDENKKEDNKKAGNVYLSDLYLTDIQTKLVNHVSIDRFTGGAREGALYTEEPLYGGKDLVLKIQIINKNTISKDARKAFYYSILDLSEGKLPIGAGVNRGNGYFKTTNADWKPILEKWLEES